MKNTKIRVISFIVALAMLVTVLPLTVIASELSPETDTSGDPVDVAGVIRDGESLTLTVPDIDDGTYAYVKFTPENDGIYILSSESDTDPRVDLFSSELVGITYADDDNGSNFILMYDSYVAGETYYFAICDYDGENVCKITLNYHEHTDVNGNGVCDDCGEFAGSTGYELTVGSELTVEEFSDGTYVKFVAEKSGMYTFESHCVDEPFDSYAELYDSELNKLHESEDISEDNLNFRLQYELAAGETYYIYVYQYYVGVQTPITVAEPCDVHTPGTRNCLGYECSVCGTVYGEGNDIHSPSGEADCRGTWCDRCEKYYGEPAYDHVDDNGDALCDECGSIFTEITFTVGENTASLIVGNEVYYKFIPTENGIYYFRSVSQFDPKLYVYDENSNQIGENDDTDDSNFYLELELEADKVYYIGLYEYREDNDCTVIINKPCDEHTPDERNCQGYECSACGEFVDEPSDNHVDDDGDSWCNECGSIFTELTVTVGENTASLIADNEVYYKFTPTENGIYYFRSVSQFDPKLYVYDENSDKIGENDDADDSNFYLELELEADKVYYIRLYEFEESNDCTVIINKLCDEHTPGERNCQGYECSACGAFVDEPSDNHVDDDGDAFCDECDSIFTELTFTVGENTASLVAGKIVYYKFTPTENGNYYFRSVSQFDPGLYVYDENGEWMGENDDADGRNFYLELELEAGKVYYLSLFEHREDNNCTVIINKLCDEHTPGEQGCYGYECLVCGAYYGETYHENVRWMFDTTMHNGYCNDCEKNIAFDAEHNFDADGKCVCGYLEHEHVFDAYEYIPAYHWLVCSICGLEYQTNEVAVHKYDEDGVCECGREHLTDGIYLGATLLRDGEYLDNDGNVTTTAPEGSYAYYNDGVLILNNFKLVNYDQNPIYGGSAIYSETDLEILFTGMNHLESLGDDAIYVVGADLTVGGDGSVYLIGRELMGEGIYYVGNGIDVDAGNLTVNGATIYIHSSRDGINAEGSVEINGGSLHIHSYNNGIAADEDITINGGFFELEMALVGIFARGNATINSGIFNFNCQFYAIYSYDGITFGDAMGEQNIFEDAEGFYWTDSDDSVIKDAQLIPDGEEKTILEYAWVENALKMMLVYNGEVQNPFGTVYNGDDTALILGVDYTVEYFSEVKNAGVYYALVAGIGDYVGTYVITFSIHERYDLKTDSALEFNAETMVAEVYTVVKFVAPTSAAYTFKVDMGLNGYAALHDTDLVHVNEYRSEDGVIIITLELKAGETVYFDVYTMRDEPAPTTMSVEFVCDEHDMDAVATDEPTCTEGGEITYTCQNGCGHTYTEELDAIGHNFVEIDVNYTECTVCGEGICDHMCHAESGIYHYIWKVFEKIYDFLDIETDCYCGEKH